MGSFCLKAKHWANLRDAANAAPLRQTGLGKCHSLFIEDIDEHLFRCKAAKNGPLSQLLKNPYPMLLKPETGLTQGFNLAKGPGNLPTLFSASARVLNSPIVKIYQLPF